MEDEASRRRVPAFRIDQVRSLEREPDGQVARVLVRSAAGQEVVLEMARPALFELVMSLMASPISQIGDEHREAVNVLIPILGWGRRSSVSSGDVLQLAVTPTEALQLKFQPGTLDQMLAQLQTTDFQPGQGLSRKN